MREDKTNEEAAEEYLNQLVGRKYLGQPVYSEDIKEAFLAGIEYILNKQRCQEHTH